MYGFAIRRTMGFGTSGNVALIIGFNKFITNSIFCYYVYLFKNDRIHKYYSKSNLSWYEM